MGYGPAQLTRLSIENKGISAAEGAERDSDSGSMAEPSPAMTCAGEGYGVSAAGGENGRPGTSKGICGSGDCCCGPAKFGRTA
ncbi:hypothetical protein GCM10010994_07350 [Chelatococcus reniformis]|uniref:Uncharacterized protein n=1 Tax=Chelatococcus reniformis TaxID=1494448 RepID=A0A916TXP0_9HYPH|nr:hypothetical protein GCM10010994_07350 [Chelatococcus reniformis]